MKNDDLIALALAGIAVWMIFASRKAGAASQPFTLSGVSSPGPFVNEVLNAALPGQPGWGWQYFDNGTAIDPSGAYWYQGQRVWAP